MTHINLSQLSRLGALLFHPQPSWATLRSARCFRTPRRCVTARPSLGPQTFLQTRKQSSPASCVQLQLQTTSRSYLSKEATIAPTSDFPVTPAIGLLGHGHSRGGPTHARRHPSPKFTVGLSPSRNVTTARPIHARARAAFAQALVRRFVGLVRCICRQYERREAHAAVVQDGDADMDADADAIIDGDVDADDADTPALS